MQSVFELFDWGWRLCVSLFYDNGTMLLGYAGPAGGDDSQATDIKEVGGGDDTQATDIKEVDGGDDSQATIPDTALDGLHDEPNVEEEPNSDLSSGIHVSRQMLGEGQFSVVRAGHITDGSRREVAVKSICNVLSTYEMIALEISILQELQQCGSVVRLLSTFEDELFRHLIFERCSHDLFSEIERSRRGRLPEAGVRKVARELGDALSFCHARCIAHRDIKPENVLVRSDGSVCLADFGLSKRFDDGARFYTQVGSAFYVAPEVFLHGDDGYDQACDAWSFGVIIYCALTGHVPFYAATEADVIRNIKQGRALPRHASLSERAFAFIRLLVEHDVRKRLTVHDACAHRFLKGD